MDKDPGRDIGPDETRTLPSNDLQMDLSIEPMDEGNEDSHQYHSIYNSSQENNISSMPPGYTQHRVYGTDRVVWTQFIEEPLDMTPAESNPIGHDAAPEPIDILANNPLLVESVRLQTFSGHWPPHAPVSAKDLAKNGFYYLGPEDRVRCVQCAGVLKNWAPGDTVEGEHRIHFPQCSMNRPSGFATASSAAASMPHSDSLGVLPKCSENGDRPPREDLGIVKSNPKYPRYAIESDRLKTFKFWPTQMKQKPEDLAKAGLFYLGKGDKTKCFMCDGTIHSWEPVDDPMSEHARWFPDCAFVKLSREDNSSSQNGITVPDTENSQTSASVQALIDNGYTLESISDAINKLHIDGVDENVIPAAEEILKTILDTDGEEDCGRGEANLELHNGDGQTDKEVKALLDENRELKEQRLCKICLENEISVIFLPCGHLSCCRQCATSLSECPICRTIIKGTAKAFWA